MKKYVITDATLSAIADAIRAKTGKADAMTPAQMPAEIGGISVGVDVTLIDNIDIVPNFATGNQIVVAQEGYAVKGATILKPATLIPENIAEGVEIAGVVGTHAGGGTKPFDCHSVTFVYGDKSYVRSVADGDTCAEPVERGLIPTPTKESTDAEDFTFSGGWSATPDGEADANILKNITEDKTVYAVFTATVRMYTITYLDDDGVKVLKTVTLPYGATPEEYTPGKDGHAFTGWDKVVTTVTGDATYTATWVTAVGGACGDSASWMFNADTGVLTISGTGATYDYSTPTSSNPVPWVEYISGITSIVIDEGITTVGNWSFYNHTAATSITIPTTMRLFGSGSLNSTSALKSVYYNGTLEQWLQTASFTNSPFYFGEGSLYLNGTLLTDVVIPESITNIPDYAFQNCGSITSVTFHPAVTYIGSASFACPNLASAIFPEGITTLGYRAFNGTTSLTGIEIPSTVTDLANAFYNCKWLTSFTVPETVTRLGEYAFYGCTGLTGAFTIPDTVTELGANVFYNCEYLTSINLPTHITIIPDYAFYSCSRITSFPYHSGVTKIGRSAFASSNNSSTSVKTSFTLYAATKIVGPSILSGTKVTSATWGAMSGWMMSSSEDLSNAETLPSSSYSDATVRANTLKSNLYAGKWKFRY